MFFPCPWRGETSPFPPIIPVQAAEIDGRTEVARLNILAAVEVGDGASHFQDAVVGAGRQSQTVHIVRGQEEKDALHTFGCLKMIVLWAEGDYSACEKQWCKYAKKNVTFAAGMRIIV